MDGLLLSPAGFGTAELTEKRSRFIGRVWPVWDEAEARRRIEETRSEFYDARHNPWCYIAGGAERSSDDGEPAATAGAPMLEVFRREGVTNFCCVVTRYFGGVLLGAGGLTRMYVNTAKRALDKAGIGEYILFESVKAKCAYGFFEKLKAAISATGGILESVAYETDIAVTARVPADAARDFVKKLSDVSAGKIAAVRTGEFVYQLENYK